MSAEDDNLYAEDIKNMGFGRMGVPYGLFVLAPPTEPRMDWGRLGSPMTAYSAGGDTPEPSVKKAPVIVNFFY